MGSNSKAPDSADTALSKALVITRPMYSYALMAFAAAGLITILWGVFGSIPQKIEGIGEITTKEGLHQINALYGGMVDKIHVDLNDTVKKGDVLIEIRQPEMEQKIFELEANVNLLVLKDSLLKSGNHRSTLIKSSVDGLGKQALLDKQEELKKTIANLQILVNQRMKLYQDGLITYTELFETKNELASAQTENIELEEQIFGLELNSNEWNLGKEISETDINNELKVLSNELTDLKKEYDLRSKIRASTDGVIVQLSTDVGDVVSPDIDLVIIMNPQNYEDYIVNLYVPFSYNEPIKEGMVVDLEPFSVDHNLYGWLKGKVIEADQYISSSYSILNDVEDPELVSLIEANGPVYKVVVSLTVDTETESGFQWSNKSGPPYKILPGQMSLGYVHVKNKAPIDYLIPIFKAYFE